MKSSIPEQNKPRAEPPARGSIVTLKIDSLAHGGSGVGRKDGIVYFVPFAAPEDLVEVEVTAFKKNYAEASLRRLVEPSPLRQQPPCPAFGVCGGCQWQHVRYAEQLRQKELMVSHALARIGKEEDLKINPIIGSPDELHYRNRAQFRIQGPHVGFYRRNSHELVEFEKCHILEPPLNEELRKIKEEASAEPTDRETKVEVFLSNRGVHRFKNQAHSEETGFAQVNTKQNHRLVEHVLGLLTPISGDANAALLDLYCGNGNFSLPAHFKLGLKVHGVDASQAAIRAAQRDGTTSTEFIAADCSREVKRLVRENRMFSALLLDPPRIGCDESLWEQLVELRSGRLIYVSCNPSTFARDWARLKAATHAAGGKCALNSVQPFDMFPQTFHVELVADISLKF